MKFLSKYQKIKVRLLLLFLVIAIENLSKVSKATDISGKAFVFSNFLMNLAFSSSLNMLWTLVNALQIIVHLPLVNLSLPINSYIVSQTLANIASFDIVPTQFLYYKTFEFKEK